MIDVDKRSDGCNAAIRRKPGWYVVDHDRDDAILRGPFREASVAGAVRTEMERHTSYDDRNLWIVSEEYWND